MADPSAAVAEVRLWYHTMELAPGVVTPGWFDLRPILDRLPWPDVRGKRCLDVGTYDGHLAFELERRGAAEVVAIDIPDHESWDWPVRLRRRGIGVGEIAGEKGLGFRVAHGLLGSSVRRVETSVYDLAPERLGRFDVVVCGDLMLHLRDPVRAVEAIAGVCDGSFMSTEQIWLGGGRRPLAELDAVSDLCQWWRVNRSGHRRIVEAGGFDVEAQARPFLRALRPGAPPSRPLAGRPAARRVGAPAHRAVGAAARRGARPAVVMLGGTVLLAVAAAALGAAAWRVAGLAADAPLERAVAAAPLAVAAAVLEALLLGRVGAGGDTAALAGAALVTWLAARATVGARPGTTWWSGGPAFERSLAGAAGGAVLALVVFMLFHPGVGPDGSSYHLPEALAWVQGGDTGATPHVAEEFRSGSYPLTNEVILAWGLAVARNFSVVALWTGAALALFAAAAWAGLRRLGCGPAWAACAIGAVLADPVLFSQLNTPKNDLPALAWLTACAALCASAVRARRPALLGPALAAAGLAAGTKTTTLPLLVLVLAATVWILRSELRDARVALAAGALAAVGVGGVWYLRNLAAHGWFFYPFSSGPFGGDRVPVYLRRIDASFLARPRASLAGARLGWYVGDVAGGLALVAGGVGAALSRPRSRLVIGVAAATAVAAVAWAAAPYTGRADNPFLDLSRTTTRYMLPVLAAGAAGLGLAARTSRVARVVLVVALGWSLIRTGMLDSRDLPKVGTLLAGAVGGAVAASLPGRGLWRRRAMATAAVVATVVVAAIAAGGWMARVGRTHVTAAAELEQLFGAVPGWGSDRSPLAFVTTVVGPLAGDHLSHPLTLIPAQEPCARTLRRTRGGWVIAQDLPRSSAAT